MKPTKGFITMTDPKDKTRAMCFKNRETAQRYMEYLSRFRSRTGRWPNLNMRESVSFVKRPEKIRYRSPEDVLRFMEIVDYDRDRLDDIARHTNLSFVYIVDFENTDTDEKGNMIFKAQEIDSYVDINLYTQNLELNLKIG
jgi:hypothetical protein